MEEKNKDGAEKKVIPPVTEEKKEVPLQDPLKDELIKVQNKKGTLTRVERLQFEKKKIEDQLKEEIGNTSQISEDENKPVTVGMLNEIERGKATQNALSLADDVENEIERELIKHHLADTIKPSGDAQKDFKAARALVNSLKNSQIATEVTRKTDAKRHNSSAGAPGNHEKPFEPTAEEAIFMRPPYSLTKEQIISKRPQQQD